MALKLGSLSGEATRLDLSGGVRPWPEDQYEGLRALCGQFCTNVDGFNCQFPLLWAESCHNVEIYLLLGPFCADVV